MILHTLSKAFGAAGTRLGYVIAAPEVIDVFAAIRQIYSVNVLSQAAALACVRARDAYAPVVAQVASERERELCALRAMAAEGMPVEAWPSAANFVLVRTSHATRVRERLRDEYSILVRDFSYAPGLADCLRNHSLAPILFSDCGRSVPWGCYPSSFHADSYSVCPIKQQ